MSQIVTTYKKTDYKWWYAIQTDTINKVPGTSIPYTRFSKQTFERLEQCQQAVQNDEMRWTRWD